MEKEYKNTGYDLSDLAQKAMDKIIESHVASDAPLSAEEFLDSKYCSLPPSEWIDRRRSSVVNALNEWSAYLRNYPPSDAIDKFDKEDMARAYNAGKNNMMDIKAGKPFISSEDFVKNYTK